MIPKNKISRYKKLLVKNCSSCGGESCSKCMASSARADIYAECGIPPTYWPLAFKDFSGDSSFKALVSNVLKDIDSIYDSGRSLVFTGGLGTGKTYAACSILKIASVSGYKSKYTTMATIISSMLSASTDSLSYTNTLIGCDFLVIDEFDSRWIFPSEKAEQMFGSSLEHILRMRFQNGTPTILCSNTPDVDSILCGDFGKAFKSLRSKHMELVCVGGVDFRRFSKNG